MVPAVVLQERFYNRVTIGGIMILQLAAIPLIY